MRPGSSSFGLVAAAIAMALAAGALAVPAVAADDAPAYPTSPYHGVTDGNGNIIPCRCRYQDRLYPVGEVVCMSTYAGTVLTRCDLFQNNTTWVPTTTSCSLSAAPRPSLTMLAALHGPRNNNGPARGPLPEPRCRSDLSSSSPERPPS